MGVAVLWSGGCHLTGGVTAGATDHFVIVITSELLSDVLVTSLMT